MLVECPGLTSYQRIPVRFPFFLLLALSISQRFLGWRSCCTAWCSKCSARRWRYAVGCLRQWSRRCSGRCQRGPSRGLDPLGWRRSFRLVVIVGFCTLSTSLARGYWLQVRRLWGVWRICRRCGRCIDPCLTLQLRGGRWLCLISGHGASSGWLGPSDLKEHKSFAQRNE